MRSTQEEAAAHARDQQGYEQTSRVAEAQHAKQFGPSVNYVDPNASIKAENARWEAERRAEHRAREAASQPYKTRSVEPQSHRTEDRQPLPQPAQGAHARLAEAIRNREATRARDHAITAEQSTTPEPRHEVSPRRAAMLARHGGAAHEHADRAPAQQPKREFASRREAMAARYTPGREVSDRMTASAGPSVENIAHSLEQSARRRAMMEAASKGAAPEQENGRDR